MTAAHTPPPMTHARVIRIVIASRDTNDLRKARRASAVAMRWTDRNSSSGWVLSEYYALRRKAVRKASYYTARYLRNARARAALAKVEP